MSAHDSRPHARRISSPRPPHRAGPASRVASIRAASVAASVAATLLVGGIASHAHADLFESRGAVDAVTVFRGQALVSRLIELQGPAGLREVVVTELPEFIIPASLYAESADGVEVRSVSYRVRPLAEDARESVRELDTRLRTVRDKIDSVKGQQAYLEWQRVYLDKLENFLTVTAAVENSRGVLNAETVGKMTELILKQRLSVSETGRTLALELRSLDEERVLIERERETIAVKTSRSAREAVVFVNQTAPKTRLRLNYLVDRASWSPSYNLRAAARGERKSDSGEVTIDYQASIQQMSGEDWTNVQLTLSTATPALVAGAPPLETLTIALAPPVLAKPAAPGAPGGGGGGDGRDSADYALAMKSVNMRKRQAEDNRNVMAIQAQSAQIEPAGQDINGGFDKAGFSAQALADAATTGNDQALNQAAAEGQLLDVLTKERFDRKEKSTKTLAEPTVSESVSVTYAIATRTSVPSRTDQQLIQIARLQAPASFYKTATPVLTANVFDEATITNTSDMVLLAGPSASYAGGEFVGRGTVPTVAVGQVFTAGFGIDSSLRASRELVERTESTQGGNRVVNFTYRLSLENFSKKPVPVRLMDRLPHPKGNDIKLTLVSAGGENQPLSTDPTFERTQRKNGLLRWDLVVPPERSAADPFSLEYRFQLEYDRQMAISQTATP